MLKALNSLLFDVKMHPFCSAWGAAKQVHKNDTFLESYA
ncbi:hypothetical protein FM102_08655 [Corynebacterium glutamicum]|nr:hypothetical protein FM102_08655 [Corynebacterium glutamicum]